MAKAGASERPSQEGWDDAEVAALADRFDLALHVQESLRLDVARLTGELKKAKQRLKEAGWDVANRAAALRKAVAKRRGGAVPPPGK